MERDPFLPQLRARLKSRCAELEDECDRVRAALQALEPAAARRPKPKPKPDPPALSGRLLRMICEDAGVRTSMLALEVGKPPDAVGREIARMHERGLIQRDGRGWRLAGPPDA